MTYIDKMQSLLGVPVVVERRRPVGSSPNHTYDVFHNKADAKAADRDSRPVIATFCLCQLPGCCGVCVSYHTQVYDPYRHRGIGKLLMKLKEQLAYDSGYTLMLATDRIRSTYQQKIFTASNWDKAAEFKNRRSGNEVGVHVRKLADTHIILGFPNPGISVV